VLVGAEGSMSDVHGPDTYVQPSAADPVLEPASVIRLARRHLPRASEVLGIDESGGEARAYLLDSEAVLKTQRPHRLRPRTSLAKERQVLEHVEQHTDIAVPRVLGYGIEGSIEYILLSRVPGVAMRDAQLNPQLRRAAIQELGETLRGLHEMEQGELASSPLVPGDRSEEDLQVRLTAAFDRVEAAVSSWPQHLSLSEIARRALEPPPACLPLCVLHSNPGPVHTFVEPVSGAFTGLIDFGDAYRSHPVLDMRTWRDWDDAQDLMAGYSRWGALDPSFKRMWRTMRILVEISLTTRGQRDPADACKRIERLLKAEP
jgi:hygromycin-B 7''-O-kinase